jgi:hypothetical protein
MNTAFFDCRKIISGLLALSLSCVAFSQGASQGTSWTRPDADFSKYSKFLVKPLDITDVKVLKPAWEQDNSEKWEFTPDAGEAIQALYMGAMTEALSKDDGYPVVSEEGDDVLQLEVEFLSITPYMKPGMTAESEGSVIETLGSGDVVVSAELRDSITGSVLVLVEGERKIGSEYKELSRENHVANLTETFSTWGNRLRTRMDELRSQ